MANCKRQIVKFFSSAIGKRRSRQGDPSPPEPWCGGVCSEFWKEKTAFPFGKTVPTGQGAGSAPPGPAGPKHNKKTVSHFCETVVRRKRLELPTF